MQTHRQMELDGVEITSKKIIDHYLGRCNKPTVMLLEEYKKHNERCHKLIGKDMSLSTVTRYETSLKHTKDFILHNFGKDDVPIESVNHKFIVDYEFYFKTERNCSHNTTMKYLKNFKKIIRIALMNEQITKDPFRNIKFHYEEIEKDFLEDHELHSIIKKDFHIERLAQVRDIFIFCSFTGVAFSDVKQLTKEHIARDSNGALWIVYNNLKRVHSNN